MALPLDGLVVAQAGDGSALHWAGELVARLGAALVAHPSPADALLIGDDTPPMPAPLPPVVVPVAADAEPVAWATSGLMHLTGPVAGPPALSPGPIATRLRGAAAAVSLLAQLGGGPPLALDGAALAAERAATAGLHRRGRRSAGGTCRLVPAADGWLAVNLARPDDVDALPAWLGEPTGPDPWPMVERVAGRGRAVDLAASARVLGLPVSVLGEPGMTDEQLRARGQAWPLAPFLVDEVVPVARLRSDPARPRRFRAAPVTGAVVVDLSSLWAGPLCAHVLGLAGAHVVKVESTARPDGARRGPPAFFDLLHAGHRCHAVDLAHPAGRAELQALVAAADVVVEASRPRALDQLGIDRRPTVDHGGTWVAVTGYGHTGPWRQAVAFGDDAAVAAGCVARVAPVAPVAPVAAGCATDVADLDLPAQPGPWFCADALADPAAGLHAAVAALACIVGGGGRVVDVALREAAGALLGPPPAGGWQVSEDGRHVVGPHGLRAPIRAPRLGARSERVVQRRWPTNPST